MAGIPRTHGWAPLVSIDDSTRHQLVVLARRKHARVVEFRPDRPIEWRPREVRNPSALFDTQFAEAAAWELIASQLESGHPVDSLDLQKPPGATAYVMLIELESDKPPLYVKFQLGSGKIIARSFHYSTRK